MVGEGVPEFADQVALISGTGGIGLATALRLARHGASVHLLGIDSAHNETAEQVAVDLDVTIHHVDVTQDGQVQPVLNSITDVGGGVDILVNAAAIQTYGTVETTDPAHWDRVMNVNLRASYLLSHRVYPSMKARGGGSIVHLASVQGHANQSGVLAYATTKGAILAMTRAMAVDGAADNIRVNSVSPGSVRTPLLETSARHFATAGESVDDMVETFGQAHPVGRVGTVEEVAELIAFLVSDRAGFCTGADYLIDGGLMARLGV